MAACKYGDPLCPCQDGDMCHYEGPHPMRQPALKPIAVLDIGPHESGGINYGGRVVLQQFAKPKKA